MHNFACKLNILASNNSPWEKGTDFLFVGKAIYDIWWNIVIMLRVYICYVAINAVCWMVLTNLIFNVNTYSMMEQNSWPFVIKWTTAFPAFSFNVYICECFFFILHLWKNMLAHWIINNIIHRGCQKPFILPSLTSTICFML